MKAGSAYVPMDPDYPPDRLAIMAGDSKVCLPILDIGHGMTTFLMVMPI